MFVAVLSHGDENGVYGIDYPIGYEELMAPLKECDTLVGKPKMFLVQVCCSSHTGGQNYEKFSVGRT